ncbi:CoA pyrophosphatase, partial [Escherichia sp. R-CC3]
MEYRSLTLDDFLSRFQLLRPQINRETLNHRQAAVLIPIVRRPQPGLLLTQRSIHLRKHAGQVAFPGGAVDDTDASVIAAALREAEVSAVFEMPLAQALHLGRYHPLDIYRRGDSHRVWLSWYEQYFVWGMTAGIIRELA